jgi:hypothetical protein
MEKSKIIELIRNRIKSDEEELQRQKRFFEENFKYAVPDYSYYAGRKEAFKEAMQLIGMLDKNNNK